MHIFGVTSASCSTLGCQWVAQQGRVAKLLIAPLLLRRPRAPAEADDFAASEAVRVASARTNRSAVNWARKVGGGGRGCCRAWLLLALAAQRPAPPAS